MIDSQKKLQALLGFLKKDGILFSRVSEDSMKDRAVAKFSFNPEDSACILYGSFQDRLKELTYIAHEAGHILTYKKMNREETRNYLCTMFAANKMGLEKIASGAQRFILEVEAEASARGLAILREIGVGDGDLTSVKQMMSQWYATYEKRCQKDVVKEVRKRILEGKTLCLFKKE